MGKTSIKKITIQKENKAHNQKGVKKERRKYNEKKIEDARDRQKTYYNRKTGLIKKANELATLCAVEVVIIIKKNESQYESFSTNEFESDIDTFYNNKAEYQKKEIPQYSAPLDSDKNKVTKKRVLFYKQQSQSMESKESSNETSATLIEKQSKKCSHTLTQIKVNEPLQYSYPEYKFEQRQRIEEKTSPQKLLSTFAINWTKSTTREISSDLKSLFAFNSSKWLSNNNVFK